MHKTDLIEIEPFWYLLVCKQKDYTYSKLNCLKKELFICIKMDLELKKTTVVDVS